MDSKIISLHTLTTNHTHLIQHYDLLSALHYVVNYGLVFWGNSSYSFKSLGCKRGQSELLWDVGVEILVRICSSN
jgi:hypothetical protein